MMVRTINEDKCSLCGAITNYYNSNMGRLCPKCMAKQCAIFGKNLAHQGHWGLTIPTFNETFDESVDMKYLAEGNKCLLTDPLIDHSADIELAADAYHISNAYWEEWLEHAREGIKTLTTKEKRQKFLLDVLSLCYKVSLTTAKKESLDIDESPPSKNVNSGALKDCARYKNCVSSSDWKKTGKYGFTLETCPHLCPSYSHSYSVWG